jgi:hypothetical protein
VLVLAASGARDAVAASVAHAVNNARDACVAKIEWDSAPSPLLPRGRRNNNKEAPPHGGSAAPTVVCWWPTLPAPALHVR